MQRYALWVLLGCFLSFEGVLAAAVKDQSSHQSGSSVVALEGISISGNQELPKVLYIIPWKKPANPVKQTKQRSLLDMGELIKPLDPNQFRKQLHFRNHLDVMTAH